MLGTIIGTVVGLGGAYLIHNETGRQFDECLRTAGFQQPCAPGPIGDDCRRQNNDRYLNAKPTCERLQPIAPVLLVKGGTVPLYAGFAVVGAFAGYLVTRKRS